MIACSWTLAVWTTLASVVVVGGFLLTVRERRRVGERLREIRWLLGTRGNGQ